MVAQAIIEGGVAHPDRMREASCRAGARRLGGHRAVKDSAVRKSLHLVELSRVRLDRRRPRPPPRPYLGLARARRKRPRFYDPARRPRLGAPLRPRPGDGGAGGLTRVPGAMQHAASCGVMRRRTGTLRTPVLITVPALRCIASRSATRCTASRTRASRAELRPRHQNIAGDLAE